jgi:hypothetical protein
MTISCTQASQCCGPNVNQCNLNNGFFECCNNVRGACGSDTDCCGTNNECWVGSGSHTCKIRSGGSFCGGNSDCASNNCNTGTGVCNSSGAGGQCIHTQDCTSLYHCNDNNGVWECCNIVNQACNGDGDCCGPNNECWLGSGTHECKIRATGSICLQNSDCATNSCNTATQTCNKSGSGGQCIHDQDCTSSLHCTSNRCG